MFRQPLATLIPLHPMQPCCRSVCPVVLYREVGDKENMVSFCMSISFAALITGMSDKYLAIFALIGLLPLYAFKNLKVGTYIFILAVLSSEFWSLHRMTKPQSGAASQMEDCTVSLPVHIT